MYLTIDVHIYYVVFPFFLKNVIKLMTHPTPNKKKSPLCTIYPLQPSQYHLAPSSVQDLLFSGKGKI